MKPRMRPVSICNGYSAEAEPLVPMLKLSINLTVFPSSGTVVPPDCKVGENEHHYIINVCSQTFLKATKFKLIS